MDFSALQIGKEAESTEEAGFCTVRRRHRTRSQSQIRARACQSRGEEEDAIRRRNRLHGDRQRAAGWWGRDHCSADNHSALYDKMGRMRRKR